MYQVIKRNAKFLVGLMTLSIMMCSLHFITNHAFLALSLAVPGLGAGLSGALFGGVGIFWGTVAGIASLGAGVVVSA